MTGRTCSSTTHIIQNIISQHFVIGLLQIRILRNSIEVIILPAILFALGRTALLEQVTQRVVAVGIRKRIVGVDFQLAGAAGEPVQGIVGICRAALEVFRSIAVPLELRQCVALGVVGVLILDLGRLVVELEGISVYRLEEVALRVIGILLDPAIGIGQLDRAVGIIVDIGVGAFLRVNDTGEVIHRIIEVGDLAAVRIGNAGLIADSVIGVGNRITLVVGHLLEAAKEVQLEGVGASPVIHLHQFADLVILVGDFLCPIVIDFLHQIKGGVGIPGHIAVRVGLGDQIAVAVVDINGAVAKRVHLHRGGDGDFYALLELTVT